jgi:hypothetical protein
MKKIHQEGPHHMPGQCFWTPSSPELNKPHLKFLLLFFMLQAQPIGMLLSAHLVSIEIKQHSGENG